MTRLTISKAKVELTDIVNRAAQAKERTVLSRRGKGIAAVVPIEDLRLLEHLTREEMDRQDLEGARKALRGWKDHSNSRVHARSWGLILGVPPRIVVRGTEGPSQA